MDRPSQKPPERPGPPSEAGESPLSFPVEAPKPPLDFPAEVAPPAVTATAGPLAPADAASPPPNPLAFPAEATPPADAPLFAAAAPADPFAFPAQAPPPPEQLPFPVAELPGSVTAVPPPAPPAEPAPVPVTAAETPAGGLLRFLPPVLTAVAALMTVGGCFLPLFRLQEHVSVHQGFFEAQLTVTQNAWGSRTEIPGQDAADQGGAPVGIPLILAVIVLAAAAFTAFSWRQRGLGRWLIAAGALFSAGVVTTVGMSGLGWSAMAEGLDLEVITEAGMWLLIGATVLAGVAAVLAYLPAWRRTGDDWADPTLAYADTPTPPTGVAITVLPPEEPG
ncbi:hypothetical protein [Amycolatopsis sp. NPDC051371]|uniref:hypothetical protein n=1 Tax=Amycolatopsis sp. NPDC051371 TaxID=3155800 RepID=UPI00342769BB